MLGMDDPKIISYARPLSLQEKLEQKPVNFAEEGFIVGALVFVNGWPGWIPPKVGRLRASRVLDKQGLHRQELKMKNVN